MGATSLIASLMIYGIGVVGAWAGLEDCSAKRDLEQASFETFYILNGNSFSIGVSYYSG